MDTKFGTDVSNEILLVFKTQGISQTLSNTYDGKFCKKQLLSAIYSLSSQNFSIKRFPKKNHSEKNSYIFSKQIFSFISGNGSLYFPPSVSQIFPALKKFLIYSQKSSQFSGNRNPEKIVIFPETKFSYTSRSNFSRSKFFYTFSYKEAKFSKLKSFLTIINDIFLIL